MNRLEMKGRIYEASENIANAQNTKARLKNELLNALNEPLNFNLLFGCVEGLKTADETIKKERQEIENLKKELSSIKE